jgi:hypothetical protein
MRPDESLSTDEAEALRLWRENVPHAFSWSAPRGGPSLLQGLNAAGKPIGKLPDAIVLAAHPSQYDIGWQVPKGARAPGLRGPIQLGAYGSPFLIGILRFPSDADLLTAWTRFDHLNAELAIRRLSRRDERRYLLPYGARVSAAGEEVLFNRNYQPIYTRPCATEGLDERWFYDDGHSEAEKRRRAEAALERFLAGRCLPDSRNSESKRRR